MEWYMWPVVAFPFVLFGLLVLWAVVFVIDQLVNERVPRWKIDSASDKWDERVCDVCGDPATEYKTLPPWPGTSYSHTSMTCDAHRSYLDGATWSRSFDGEWHETKTEGMCGTCHAPYGSCEHTAHYQAMLETQQAGAVRGKVASR